MDWMELLNMAFRFDHYLGDVIAMHSTVFYLAVFAVVFCEFAFLPLFFLPANPLIFTTGAFCASGLLSIWLLLPLLTFALFSGSLLNYRIGQAVGQRFSTRERRWLNPASLHRTRRFYEEHGSITFLLSPFIAVVRTFAPFVAGMSAMTFCKFLSYVLIGAVIWVALLLSGGYFFGNVPLVREHMSSIALLGVALALFAIALSAAWKYIAGRVTRHHPSS